MEDLVYSTRVIKPIEAVLDGVHEHNEGMPVMLARHNNRLVLKAENEGGYNGTLVDIEDLVAWLLAHPDWRELV